MSSVFSKFFVRQTNGDVQKTVFSDITESQIKEVYSTEGSEQETAIQAFLLHLNIVKDLKMDKG